MTVLALYTALELARACTVPGVPAENVVAVAQQESPVPGGVDTLAIGDDDGHRSLHPASAEQAEAIANSLLAKGHSVGIGLLQLTARSPELLRAKFGLTVHEALAEPCKNVRAGATLLAQNWRQAVRASLQLYNSGSLTGAPNYATSVERIASRMPLIHAAPEQAPPSSPPASVPVFVKPKSGREFTFSANR